MIEGGTYILFKHATLLKRKKLKITPKQEINTKIGKLEVVKPIFKGI